MIELISLEDKNFQDFISLLNHRGEVPADYYYWKYIDQPSQGMPTGFIAYSNNIPVGCIGIINRVYTSGTGEIRRTTWFADWFVLEQVRGQGVGKLLMEKVRTSGDINLGTPGPQYAQKVCKSAGYYSDRNLTNLVIYLKPFLCGFKRSKGSMLKKMIRSIRAAIKFYNISISIRGAGSFEFVPKFPEVSHFHAIAHMLLKRGYLERNNSFLHWIKTMPFSEASERSWWYIHHPDFFSWGYTEKDFWGLNRACVLDIFSSMPFKKSVDSLCKTLLKQNVDLVKLYTEYKPLPKVFPDIRLIPLYYAGLMIEEDFYMSGIDIESAWREVQMKQVG